MKTKPALVKRLTFKREKTRSWSQSIPSFAAMYGGEKIAIVSYCQDRDRYYWYSIGVAIHQSKTPTSVNTICVEGSARDLDGCKDEIRTMVKELQKSVIE